MARQRRRPAPATSNPASEPDAPHAKMANTESLSPGQWSVRTQWIFFAIASGLCAAFNGAFAKLTTTDLTTTLSNRIADLFGLSEHEKIVEVVVRTTFFILNLVFNGVMWSLFTTALARGTSATQVSIMNTSTNFIITALLGMAIFSEKLPPLWWLGAALLVVGNVITGRKSEEETPADGYVPVPQPGPAEGAFKDNEDEDIIDLGDESLPSRD